jgi:hypothetical protein
MIPWRVKRVEALAGYRLALTFADGVSGVLDLSDEVFEGVFAPLTDPSFFAQARVKDGAVTWPNGADMAPDALYDEVMARPCREMNTGVLR